MCMETLSNETLFCKEDYECLVWAYNALFWIFNKALWPYLESEYWVSGDVEVVGIERWLWNSECQIFWDYLWASHGAVEKISRAPDNVFGKIFTYRCIKLKFKDGKSIVLSTDANPDSLPSWVISLDTLYMKLRVANQMMVENLLRVLNWFESKHFTSPEFKQNFDRVKEFSKDQLYQALNIKESTLN